MIFKIAMLLCLAAQVAIALPHHHHDDSSAACINPLHCVVTHEHDADEGEDMCCRHESSHRHDSPGNECSINHVDITIPERDKNETVSVIPAVDMMHGFFCVCSLITGTSGLIKTEVSVRISTRHYDGAIPLHTGYIKRALPPRAPSA